MLQDFVSYLFNNVGYGGILIATIIESCLIPLPSELVIPLAGAATASGMATSLKIDHTFSLLAVILVASAGEVIGACLAYLIGVTGGRELLLKYGRYVLISRHDAERADEFFAKRGDITVFVGRLLPVVRAYVSLPAGITRMSFPRFVFFTAAGSLLWCTVLALIGRKLGEHWTDVGNWIHRFDVLIILAVVVLVVLYVRRHLQACTENDRVLSDEQARHSGSFAPCVGTETHAHHAQLGIADHVDAVVDQHEGGGGERDGQAGRREVPPLADGQ